MQKHQLATVGTIQRARDAREVGVVAVVQANTTAPSMADVRVSFICVVSSQLYEDTAGSSSPRQPADDAFQQYPLGATQLMLTCLFTTEFTDER